MEITKEEVNYLENIMLSIENCENLAELMDIREEFGKNTWLISWMNWILVPLTKRNRLFKKVFGNLWYEKDK